jgi:hypothetical protein
MQYVPFRRLNRARDELTVKVRRVGLESRGGHSQDVSPHDLFKGFHCSVLKPSVVQVGGWTVDVGHKKDEVCGQNGYQLLVGVRLSLDELLALQWMRFVVAITPADSGLLSGSEAVSLWPHSVERDEAYGGHMVVRESGQVERERLAQEIAGPTATLFRPDIVGFKIDDRRVCWDFLPHDGRVPSGCESLGVFFRCVPGTTIIIGSLLYCVVTHPSLGECCLEASECKHVIELRAI